MQAAADFEHSFDPVAAVRAHAVGRRRRGVARRPARASCPSSCGPAWPRSRRSCRRPRGRPVSWAAATAKTASAGSDMVSMTMSVGAGAGEGLGLFDEGRLKVRLRWSAPIISMTPARPDRGEDRGPAGGCPQGNGRPRFVHRRRLIGQLMPGEDEAVGPEGVGEDDVGCRPRHRPGRPLRPVPAAGGSRLGAWRQRAGPRCCNWVPQAPSVATGRQPRVFRSRGAWIAPRRFAMGQFSRSSYRSGRAAGYSIGRHFGLTFSRGSARIQHSLTVPI